MSLPSPEPAEPALPDWAAPLLPLDEHNRRLRHHVHPPAWRNPAPLDRYDLVVLGGGTGGLVTAAIAAALGAQVALVERHLLGGDCLNVGCVPSKALLRAARAWAAARDAERFGGPPVSGPGDFAATMERMRRVRADISVHDSAARFRELGVEVFLGEGRFTHPDCLEVSGARLRFRRAVVATGARAAVPPVPGLAEAGYLTNETVFSLTELPGRLLVVGGGPIGCELAQAFARFGCAVTLVEMTDRLLPRDDPAAARIVRSALERDGVEVLTEAVLRRVERRGDQRVATVEVGGVEREVSADHLLIATGRAANVEEAGLAAAQIRFDRRGIETDERLRTSNSRVYAVGDVNARFPFTHAADAQARMVVQNALFYGRGRVGELVIPWTTFTSPEVAQVGLTEPEAREQGAETITIPLEQVDRFRLDGDTEGFLRVHLAAGSDRIVGATVVAEHAGELIGQLTTAMTLDIGLDRLGQTIFPYPTGAEIIRKAADAHRRGRLTPMVKKAFDLFFHLTR